MANTFKVLFRGAAAVTSTTLYTVPATSSAMITSIVVTNTTDSPQTYSLSLDGISIASGISLAGRVSLIIDPRQVLEGSGTISGLASATTVNFHISALVASP